jgi:hypothetical protein
MKTIIITLALLFSITTYSQNLKVITSIGIDVRNATLGSEPTNYKSALDIPIYLGLVGERGWGFSLGYESFKKIKYSSFNMKFSKEFKILNDKISMIPSVELVLIKRILDVPCPKLVGVVDGIEIVDKSQTIYYTDAYFFPTVGANLEINYNLNDNNSIGLRFNELKRNDLNYIYGGYHYVNSTYLTYTHKFSL